MNYLLFNTDWFSICESGGMAGLVNVLVCLAALFGNLSLAEIEWHKIRVQPVYHSSLERSNRFHFIKCNLLSPALKWLHEIVYVEDIPADSFLLEKKCPSGYYMNQFGKKYCRYDCSEAQCGPIKISDRRYTKLCRKCVNPQECYEEIGTVEEIQGTDFVLHVAAVPSYLCKLDGVLVNGAACKQHHITDRPIIGYVNFCTDKVDIISEQMFPIQVMQVVRELFKILVFSKDLLPFFRKFSGEPLMPRSLSNQPPMDFNGNFVVDFMILSTYIYHNWTTYKTTNDHSTQVIVLPTVVQKAKEHFNCSSLIGMPLEDQLELPSTLLWEQRVMMGDIMTAYWPTRPVISEITLALFEDSGWYTIDYSFAGLFSWGKGMGCDFVTSSCHSIALNEVKGRQHSFCADIPYTTKFLGCTLDYKAVTSCNIMKYSYNLPTQFMYNKFRRKIGGPIPVADYCPMYHASSHNTLYYCTGNTGCIDHGYGGLWNVSFKLGNEKLLSYFETHGAGCYQVSCAANVLHIHFKEKRITCYHDNEVKQVTYTENSRTYKGEIVCPPHERFCQAFHCVEDCNGNGRCIDGFCKCYPGYYNQDCRSRFFNCYHNWRNCSVHPQTFKKDPNNCGCYCECKPNRVMNRSGYYCERILPVHDLCAYRDCSGNGRCTRVNRGRNHRCVCKPGYEGKKCEVFIGN